jgi:NAD(P)-dependent dehydrogenase (short-subunit alcohol dehydrogenase family)
MLLGKTVLVIGAGRGLGGEIAAASVRDGAEVMLAARNEERLQELTAQLGTDGAAVGHHAADLREPAQLAELVAAVDRRFGQLTGLVLCAVHDTGIGGIESTTEDEWRESFEVNVFGAARAVKAVVPLMKRTGGSIVLIGSQQWIYPARDVPQLAYGATKGAIISMMYALSRELGPSNIRVNVVAPSWMWGPTVERYVEHEARGHGRTPDAVRTDIESRFALEHMPTDGDIAEVVGFFLSDRARAISGQSLLVNAGELGR